MAITNPYQNAAQSMYETSGTGGASAYQPSIYDVGVANPFKSRMFANPIAEPNPYRVDDVSTDMLTRLEVYTSMMLSGELKSINEEYLHAMQIILHILKRAKTRVDDKFIEKIWANATGMEGNVVENYTKELFYQLGIKR